MLDDGYWESLLRDAEREIDPVRQAGEGSRPDDAPPLRFNPAAPRRWDDSDDGDSEEDWRRAEVGLANGEPVQVKVTGYNRGGLLVEFGALQGFVPASHLVTAPAGQTPQQRAAALAAHIGELMSVKVVEIQRDRCRLILSERLTRENGHNDFDLGALELGAVVWGQVTSLCPFGAFVDLGGFEGLIHISELSWGRVGSPAEVVQPGARLELLVLGVNPEAGKVALSLKRLRPDPWLGVGERYAPGQVVEALITNVVNFGAFARLEEGLEGLIHVSELAEGTFTHPRNVVAEGDLVRAQVLQVDGEKRRIALTLRGGETSQGSL